MIISFLVIVNFSVCSFFGIFLFLFLFFNICFGRLLFLLIKRYRHHQLCVAAEMKPGDCVETAANVKSSGDGAGMRGGDAYGGSAELSVSLPPLSAVAAGQVSADVSESVADMSCDSDADVCVDDVNRTFTLMSPVTTSMSRMHGAAYADSMMSEENQQQLASVVSAADKRQMPSSGPAMLVTNQQQALSVASSASAANEQQAPASGLTTSALSATNRQQAPLAVSAASERQAFTSGLMTSAMSTANQQQAPLALMSASERSAFSSGPAMSLANQQQTPLATILAASERPPFSSVPAISSANQQQALSTASAASERQVTGGNSSVTSRHLLPVAVSSSSSFVPPGICRHCSSTFFVPTVL